VELGHLSTVKASEVRPACGKDEAMDMNGLRRIRRLLMGPHTVSVIVLVVVVIWVGCNYEIGAGALLRRNVECTGKISADSREMRRNPTVRSRCLLNRPRLQSELVTKEAELSEVEVENIAKIFLGVRSVPGK
jgi:hypothetical protein